MTRVGWVILATLIILAGCFALLVRHQPAAGPTPAPSVAASPGQRIGVPVAGVPAAQLVDSFNDPRSGGRQHQAIDILAPQGTAVLAAAPGRIDKLFDSKLGGHTVYERSSDGHTEYYYAHLDGYADGLAPGAVVQKGAIIATVGSSGDADARAPHLHFEVHRLAAGQNWWQGTPVDPYPLLTGSAAPQ